MQRSKKVKEMLPDEFMSIKEASEFWDRHEITDYWEETKEIKANIKVPKTPRYISLEKEIAEFIFRVAKKKHTSSETLVNLWLKDYLQKIANQN